MAQHQTTNKVGYILFGVRGVNHTDYSFNFRPNKAICPCSYDDLARFQRPSDGCVEETLMDPDLSDRNGHLDDSAVGG